MSDIVMPRLSDSMAEGTVVRWLKRPGEIVSRGEPIVEIETDKATITYEADVDGVIAEILVAEGETVPVGVQIARIEDVAGAAGSGILAGAPSAPGGATVPPPLAPSATSEQFAPPGAQQPAAQQPVFEPAAHGDEGGRVKASPIARRLARKLGVDLTGVTGSGPGGRIVKEDVEAASSAAAAVQSAPQAPTQAPAAPPPTEQWRQPAAETPAAGQPPVERPAEHEIDSFDLPSGEPEPLPLPPDLQPAEPQLADQFAPPGEQPEFMAPGAAIQPPTAPPPVPPSPGIPGMAPPGVAVPGMAPPDMAPPGMAPPGMQPGAMPPLMPPVAPQPVQPLPGPASFIPGMTGGFPAIQPQQPGMPAATATRGQVLPTELTGTQQTVARRMAESKATAPDFFVEVDVDMTNAVNYREQLKLAVQPAPSFNDMVLKACALALRQFPKINGAYKDGHYERYGDVNVGIVVAAADLLAVPTLFNADQKGLAQIARESRELANAVRTRTIQPAQLAGGTFSISNLGMYGVDRFTAILNPPQAAILAVGAIKRKPVIAEDGVSLAVRQIMALTLTCDHRIVYGAEGAEFLAAVKAWLESPQALPI